MENNKKPVDHNYLFSGMTDAEFAEEGFGFLQSEQDRTDLIPDDDEIPPAEFETDL